MYVSNTARACHLNHWCTSHGAPRTSGMASGMPPNSLCGEGLVGATVAVWWDGDGAWFTGTVAKYCSDMGSKNSGQHWVKYKDGDKKWHLLDQPVEVRAAAASRCL
jgi:hypothetical protein